MSRMSVAYYYRNERLPTLRVQRDRLAAGLSQRGFRFADGRFHDTSEAELKALEVEITQTEVFVAFCERRR
jgi:hypothetical protein